MPDPPLHLHLRRFLGAALFAAGEFIRAGPLLDATGRRYREPRGPAAAVLSCAYHADPAYAESGMPGKAVAQLRFYLQHYAAEEQADRRIEVRADTGAGGLGFGPDALQVRNLDKHQPRLRMIPNE